MTEDIDLSEIDKKYKDKCSLIKAGTCKNVNIFLQQSRENAELKAKIKKYAAINEQETKDYAELKAENERLEHLDEEINDFISDISTCGFKYDDRCPDNLDELQCCIEDLCNKFSNYKQTLQEIKKYIAKICKEECGYVQKKRCPDCDCRFGAILDLITKVEEVK